MQNVGYAEEKQARCEWFCFDVVKRTTIKYDPHVTDVVISVQRRAQSFVVVAAPVGLVHAKPL